ncbi:TetR/AcrR family transcriptional regulator [Embleya sp. NPDC020630]|uniref:TetR/AcrR family transcriptional regulator n=1 Tax=Embleya sp. NPDC020630 TaxID=3363979 RepID=UPI0037A4DA62
MSGTQGRPRGFDREAALDRAVIEFWQHGYEATSVSGLTAAMGIKPPSLYAAFGDKRALFSEAIQRYGVTYGAVAGRALDAEPDARRGMERMLYALAEAYTEPGHPPGCMVITAAVNCTAAAEEVKAELRALREASKAAFRRRIAADVAAGRLPADTDPDDLATYYAAVVQGMSTQAVDGVGRERLERVAELAMRSWPDGP